MWPYRFSVLITYSAAMVTAFSLVPLSAIADENQDATILNLSCMVKNFCTPIQYTDADRKILAAGDAASISLKATCYDISAVTPEAELQSLYLGAAQALAQSEVKTCLSKLVDPTPRAPASSEPWVADLSNNTVGVSDSISSLSFVCAAGSLDLYVVKIMPFAALEFQETQTFYRFAFDADVSSNSIPFEATLTDGGSTRYAKITGPGVLELAREMSGANSSVQAARSSTEEIRTPADLLDIATFTARGSSKVLKSILQACGG